MTRPAVGLVIGLSLLVSGCLSSQPSKALAANQVLRLVASQDVLTLDPAKIHQPSVELSLVRNVFSGLYRFRDDLAEVPDLATDMPVVSADGLNWTFHLRTDAHFSNGDPVTAPDVLYTWNRVAALTASSYPSAYIFDPVAGFAEMQSKKLKTLSGLSAPDDHTVVAKLTKPAGYWLVELGLWPAAVVDRRVVEQGGENDWWTTREGLVGTGPFRMSARDKGRSFDFEPVRDWWGGATGRLTRVHVDVVADQPAQLSGYESGAYDILGYAPDASGLPPVSLETIKRFTSDSRLKGQLSMRPWLKTAHLGFPRLGHMGSAADVDGRSALSLAIDRRRLADTCIEAIPCSPATGGLIYPGLAGYLGDGADRNAKHDVTAARALLGTWDPAGTRRTALRMGAGIRYRSLAVEIKSEWRAALGIDVQLQVVEGQTLRRNTEAGLYDVVVLGFIADYDSPHDWYANVDDWCQAAFLNPQLKAALAAADAKLPIDAVAGYKQAGHLLADAAACPALVYLEGVFLIKPWVKGAGGNAMYENYWTSISILAH